MYGVASLIATATVLPLLGFVAVCLRFYVRLRLKPTFVGIDDWLITFSCLLVFGQAAIQICCKTLEIPTQERTSPASIYANTAFLLAKLRLSENLAEMVNQLSTGASRIRARYIVKPAKQMLCFYNHYKQSADFIISIVG